MHQRDMHEKGSQGETFSLRAILLHGRRKRLALKLQGPPLNDEPKPPLRQRLRISQNRHRFGRGAYRRFLRICRCILHAEISDSRDPNIDLCHP